MVREVDLWVEVEESEQLQLALVTEWTSAFEDARGALMSGAVLEWDCRLRVSQLRSSGSGCLTCYRLQATTSSGSAAHPSRAQQGWKQLLPALSGRCMGQVPVLVWTWEWWDQQTTLEEKGKILTINFGGCSGLRVDLCVFACQSPGIGQGIRS